MRIRTKLLNKFILAFMILQLFSVMSIFSMAKNQSVIGYIKVYGNEPHTYLGIETQEDKVYTVVADKEILDELQKNQGYLIQLDGTITEKKTPFMGKFQFEVKNWNIVSNEEN